MGIEEIAKACATSSLILAVQALGSYPILVAGSEEQKKRLCPPLASGEKVAAYALSETGSGSDASRDEERSPSVYGNEYVAQRIQAVHHRRSVAGRWSSSRRQDAAVDHRGISAFVLEREASPWKAPKLEHKLGIRGSPTAELVFGGRQGSCREPARAKRCGLQARPGGARPLAARHRSTGPRIAEGAFDYALNYVKERRQFGQPISSFQGIQFMLADIATQIEAARHLVYRAATKVDSKAADLTKIAAMAKLFASDMAMKVTTDCVQCLVVRVHLRLPRRTHDA